MKHKNVELKRCWIDQPSILQPFHLLHGKRVLAVFSQSDEQSVVVYFTSGNVVSQEVTKDSLCVGWPINVERAEVLNIVKDSWDTLKTLTPNQTQFFSAYFAGAFGYLVTRPDFSPAVVADAYKDSVNFAQKQPKE